MGGNFYAYASGDPISRRDPFGLYDGWDFLRDFGTFSEAAVDAGTFGSASTLNDALGANIAVDRCSRVHKAGTVTGLVLLTAITAGAGTEAAVAEEGVEAAEVADTSVEFSQRVLDRMAETSNDPFHNFPSSFNQYVVENGDIGKLTENYIQYELPGSINGTPGFYQVGGDWVGDVFKITHSFFGR
jgi:hypothetical protein